MKKPTTKPKPQPATSFRYSAIKTKARCFVVMDWVKGEREGSTFATKAQADKYIASLEKPKAERGGKAVKG